MGYGLPLWPTKIHTIIFLAEDERVPLALKEKATSFLLKELYNDIKKEFKRLNDIIDRNNIINIYLKIND